MTVMPAYDCPYTVSYPLAPRTTPVVSDGAVHAIHQCGIVHRDLKPSNILLTRDGWPKIGDFGLAVMREGERGETPSGAIVGTPCYMAPEQAQGRTREVGPAADVWALGSILYELLTSRAPFRGTNYTGTLLQIVSQEPEPPRRLRPEVPIALEAICLRCLRKPIAERYPSAEALADDLRRIGELPPAPSLQRVPPAGPTAVEARVDTAQRGTLRRGARGLPSPRRVLAARGLWL
jgi:serine/threonine-protein kinase